MLDHQEQKHYESWKESKLNRELDLSYTAYNLELEAPALAWDAGWRAKESGRTLESNEYRAKGMDGYKK